MQNRVKCLNAWRSSVLLVAHYAVQTFVVKKSLLASYYDRPENRHTRQAILWKLFEVFLMDH